MAAISQHQKFSKQFHMCIDGGVETYLTKQNYEPIIAVGYKS